MNKKEGKKIFKQVFDEVKTDGWLSLANTEIQSEEDIRNLHKQYFGASYEKEAETFIWMWDYRQEATLKNEYYSLPIDTGYHIGEMNQKDLDAKEADLKRADFKFFSINDTEGFHKIKEHLKIQRVIFREYLEKSIREQKPLIPDYCGNYIENKMTNQGEWHKALWQSSLLVSAFRTFYIVCLGTQELVKVNTLEHLGKCKECGNIFLRGLKIISTKNSFCSDNCKNKFHYFENLK